MSKNKKPRPEQDGRVQVPSMYLHPQTLKTLDQIRKEMRVNRGIAVDEVVRRYDTCRMQLERVLRSDPVPA
jgi:hypothetical protein